MADYTDEKGSKHLLAEALEYAEFSRRSLLTGATALGAGALGGGLIGTASADEIHVAQATGKKVRVGVPLTYGPFNQPWRRGCWQVVKNVLDLGGEPVCVRGEPTKASEQSAERTLLDRNIDVLVMGIYSLKLENAYIVDDARKRGIKTVGFAVSVKDFAGGGRGHLGDRNRHGLFYPEHAATSGHVRPDGRGQGLLYALRHGSPTCWS